MRVALFSTWNAEYQPIADLTAPNLAAYCDVRGYDWHPCPGAFHLDPERSETYGDKVRFSLYHRLRGHYDIVVSLDIDSLFVGFDVRVEGALRRESVTADGFHFEHYGGPLRFLWTYGENGPMSGLWIARTDDVTERHLRFAYERAAVESHVRHGRIEPGGISDQDSMTALMAIPPFSDTFGNCRDAHEVGFEFTDTTNPSPWIVTARGGSVEAKLAALKEWIPKCQMVSNPS